MCSIHACTHLCAVFRLQSIYRGYAVRKSFEELCDFGDEQKENQEADLQSSGERTDTVEAPTADATEEEDDAGTLLRLFPNTKIAGVNKV